VPLTESETEYVVTCVKHIFESAVVLQFNVTNTIPEQRLLNVRVTVEGGDELYSQVASIPVKTLAYGTAGACYVILARQTGLPITLESFRCELHFKVVEIDPVTGDVEGDPAGFAEEYPLEDLEISTSDFMAKVTLGDFKRNWEALGPDHEVMEKFQLQVWTPDTMWRACPSEHINYSHCLIPHCACVVGLLSYSSSSWARRFWLSSTTWGCSRAMAPPLWARRGPQHTTFTCPVCSWGASRCWCAASCSSIPKREWCSRCAPILLA
jgi:hypothetical protein